jgi:hypothetical protein
MARRYGWHISTNPIDRITSCVVVLPKFGSDEKTNSKNKTAPNESGAVLLRLKKIANYSSTEDLAVPSSGEEYSASTKA